VSVVWYLKAFLVFMFIILVVLFGLANRGQVVTLRWWSFSRTGTQIDVVAALFIAYAAGALTLLVVSLVRELRVRQRLSHLEREADRMRRELDALRTAPLEGPLPAMGPGRTERRGPWQGQAGGPAVRSQ
jgi:uncharacterized membrane protein YcjF (UPF0283 family)